MCLWPEKELHPLPQAGEGILLLSLHLAPQSCPGEKHRPGGRTGGSYGLPERQAPPLQCREDRQPWTQAGKKPGDEAGHKVLIPHCLSSACRLRGERHADGLPSYPPETCSHIEFKLHWYHCMICVP